MAEVTITRAGFAHGYSGCDHLLDDSGMKAVVGRTFASLTAAANAAAKAAGKQDKRCAGAPIALFWEEDGIEMGKTVWPTR